MERAPAPPVGPAPSAAGAPLGAGWEPHPVQAALRAAGYHLDGTVTVHRDAGGVLHVDPRCRDRVAQLVPLTTEPLVEVYSRVGWCSCASPVWARCTAELGQAHLVLATFGPALDALRRADTVTHEALVLAALAVRLQGSAWPVADALGAWAARGLAALGARPLAGLAAVVSTPPQWWWYLPEGPRLDVYSDHVNWRHHVLTLARFELGPAPDPTSPRHWVLVDAGALDAAVSAYLWAAGVLDADGLGRPRRVLAVPAPLATGLVAWQQASLRHSVFHSGDVVALGPCSPEDPPQLAAAAERLVALAPERVLAVARAALA